jgi:PPOX class probable F420-dependent enzyme
MEEMSRAEARLFLLAKRRTAKIATLRRDGSPHVTPIWFNMDGEAIRLTTWHTSVKGKRLQRDGRLAICVDDEAPPFACVLIEWKAEFIDHPEKWLV